MNVSAMLSSVRKLLTRPIAVCRRCMSTTSGTLNVSLDDKTGVATMVMNRPPVNSLSLEFLTELTGSLEKLENDQSCRGLILTSAVPKIFSAGLDILEMYQPKPDRLREFWHTLQSVWLGLYGSRLVTMAAINGHSPAGGCLMAMCCDFRLMVPGFTIGLNETQLGIVPPFWFTDTMTNIIGHRQTELCCEKGLMLTTEQAVQIGLVDEVVPAAELDAKVGDEMNTWLNIPASARQITKAQLRKPTLDKLVSHREDDIANFINFITRASTQKALEFYMQQLRKKIKK